MSKTYRPSDIEPKWQKIWEESEAYKVVKDSSKPKYYCLDMFPYPSGSGLHVGHMEGYVATDVYSRYMRHKGYNVLHPMGWDAFGLPAENYAIKQKVHPHITTEQAIDTYKTQMNRLGLSYDWSKEINTSSPEYYKWTQWFFLLLYKHGLAYKKEAPVNWCPSCQTVLANEQVVKNNDKNVCERCDSEVIQKNLSQWFFKITDYADRLLEDLSKIDWLPSTKQGQINWIGKSEGVKIKWQVVGLNASFETFTKFPETVYGTTFVVISPEHPLVEQLTVASNKGSVNAYVESAKRKTNLQRVSLDKDKTGVFTGSYVINPVNNKHIPVWIADYVLPNYGTGAVFGVPAHDVRDFEFAIKQGIEIIRVIKSKNGDISDVASIDQVTEEGVLINSEGLNGLDAQTEGKQKAIEFLVSKGIGEKITFYNLRDWLVSRQRYWGAPIPIIYCPHCAKTSDNTASIIEKDGIKYKIIAVDTTQLPVVLPEDVDFKPTGESPIASSKSFHIVTCPECGKVQDVHRESDTMDTFVDSSWYYFRFTDPQNMNEFANKVDIEAYCPVDFYLGGAEHTVLHLLYARFFTKVLYDFGYINFDEPFMKLRHPGMILAEDSRKMSKRWGNVINPDDVIAAFGADTMRTYEMFMGPLDVAKPWNTSSVEGVRRFYNRVWGLSINIVENNINESTDEALRQFHKLLKKVDTDIRDTKFNTAIAAMMEFVNFWQKNNTSVGKDILKELVVILEPFAPHLAAELWECLGMTNHLHIESWPKYNEELLIESTIELVVQINGKVKGKIVINAEDKANESLIKDLVLRQEKVRLLIGENTIKKFLYIQGKLINIVI